MGTADVSACNLPFQYNYEEYNECINVTVINTPQCATLGGTLINCLYPPGWFRWHFSLKMCFFNLTCQDFIRFY